MFRLEQPEARDRLLKGFHDLDCPIRAAIIGHNDLMGHLRLGEEPGDRTNRLRKTHSLVIGGDHDGELWKRLGHWATATCDKLTSSPWDERSRPPATLSSSKRIRTGQTRRNHSSQCRVFSWRGVSRR